jgi:hypothetical protein
MPELKEVFEMVTKQTEPDLGSWNDQEQRQRRSVRNRKIGAFAIVAAVVAGAAILAFTLPGGDGTTDVGSNPTTEAPTAPEAAAPVGTVTFDGSTCSLEITADRIEPGPLGYVTFRVVNASDQRVMFDSWRLLDGYTFRAFETAVERTGRLAEAGKPYPNEGPFPDRETEVSYLGSEVIPANRSGSIVTRMSSPGPHAIACLQRFEGAHRSLRGFQPFGLAGPIVVR